MQRPDVQRDAVLPKVRANTGTNAHTHTSNSGTHTRTQRENPCASAHARTHTHTHTHTHKYRCDKSQPREQVETHRTLPTKWTWRRRCRDLEMSNVALCGLAVHTDGCFVMYMELLFTYHAHVRTNEASPCRVISSSLERCRKSFAHFEW